MWRSNAVKRTKVGDILLDKFYGPLAGTNWKVELPRLVFLYNLVSRRVFSNIYNDEAVIFDTYSTYVSLSLSLLYYLKHYWHIHILILSTSLNYNSFTCLLWKRGLLQINFEYHTTNFSIFVLRFQFTILSLSWYWSPLKILFCLYTLLLMQ